jgi:uncharacterized protein (TIGR02118 family)
MKVPVNVENPARLIRLTTDPWMLQSRKQMIKVSLLYPNEASTTFDMEFYEKLHVPMVRKLLGTALKGVAVDQGMRSAAGTPPPYVVMCHLLFESLDAFQGAFPSHAEFIMADIAKYTNSRPIAQISEMRL